MKFEAKSEEQIQKESLLPAGEYDFEVIEAKDTQSKKSGADMIALNLKVFRPDTGFVYARDYLMAAMAFKLVHFAKSTGLTDAYDKGELTGELCMGRCGRVRLIVEEQAGYAPKNSVKDYIVVTKTGESASDPVRHVVKAAADEATSDIPF